MVWTNAGLPSGEDWKRLMKIQPTKELFAEMRAVARGEIPSPPDAAAVSWEMVGVAAEIDPEFERQMKAAAEGMADYRDALADLAR